MANHDPFFTSPAANVSLSELINTTGSSILDAISGTLKFKDADRTDTHTASATLLSAVWSGGTGIPPATLGALTGALTASIQTDSTGTGAGVVKWAFSTPDKNFDFLSKNETLTLTYQVTVADNHGGSATDTVKVVLTGADDAPMIAAAATGTITEQAGQTLSLAPAGGNGA